MSETTKKAVPIAVTAFPIIFAISTVHLLNDTMQSSVTALFPILRDSLKLNYAQIGFIAFAMNITASIMQPIIGRYADIRPRPYILPIGVCFTLAGIIGLALAPYYGMILFSVGAMGVGSAVFHPESSRVAYLAAGRRRGMSQSIFQVGGNIGASLGPIMTALIFVPLGQIGVLWFTLAAVAAIAIQTFVARWYSRQDIQPKPRRSKNTGAASPADRDIGTAAKLGLTRRQVGYAITVLVILVFSKHVYIASISSFYSFFLINHFGISIRNAQWFLFAFLAANAAGTFFGGPLADRYGRRNVIWFSILGTAPFSLLLPYANLFWTGIVCVCAGFVLSSAFSIIVVYAQEILPGNVGLVSGLFFGLAFGIGGLGSAVLGWIADSTSIAFIMKLCAFLPLLGMLAILLPRDSQVRSVESAAIAK